MKRIRQVQMTIIAIMVVALGVLVGTILLKNKESQEVEKRKDTIEGIMSQVDAGASEIQVDPDAFAIPGEDDQIETGDYENWILAEEEGLVEEGLSEGSYGVATYIPTPTSAKAAPAPVSLTVLGTIQIPEIDLRLPIYAGAQKTQLRYGIGQLSGSAKPNQDGNCVLLGHNMRSYGALFGRLDEVVVGNEVILKGEDGVEQSYTVTAVVVVTAEESKQYMYNDQTGRTVTMVSCETIRTNRRVVIAELAT